MTARWDRSRSWSELSTAARAGVVVGGVAQLGLLVAALADLSRRDPSELRGPRALWVLLSFVNFLGPIGYFTLGRRR